MRRVEKLNDNQIEAFMKFEGVSVLLNSEYEQVTETTALYKDSIDDLVNAFEMDSREGFAGCKDSMAKLLRLNYLALGLGESGEVQGKVKKIIRDKNGVLGDDDRKEILKEVGDLFYYMTQLLIELDSDINVVRTENGFKLLSRLMRGAIKGSGDNR